ncbi:aggregation factor core [Jannaschia sp. 2305UL9-9]|uniref:aggregation factor core n=1 Tax=Jannaschia sp. 2305UL9-9 TaxID=3121638 RepID=UPI003527C96B
MTRTFPRRGVPALAAILLATPTFADVTVTFREGAPKDRFTIEQTGECGLGSTDVTIDLSGSASGLVFDVTGSGAGVQVFQPFELVAGQDLLSGQPVVRDGDQRITLPVTGLLAGQTIAFTIDVDDTVGTREITVSDSEIIGASVRVGDRSAEFGADAIARLSLPDCLS